MDITKAGRELGWRPAHTLEEGLRMTVSWYLENIEWVEAIRNRPSYQDWRSVNYGTRGVSG
jgi:dTDP-glucose 4,6-dehydratase